MKLSSHPYKEHRKRTPYATWALILVRAAPGLRSRDGLLLIRENRREERIKNGIREFGQKSFQPILIQNSLNFAGYFSVFIFSLKYGIPLLKTGYGVDRYGIFRLPLSSLRVISYSIYYLFDTNWFDQMGSCNGQNLQKEKFVQSELHHRAVQMKSKGFHRELLKKSREQFW